ncbi:hypothetical protein BU23DRAFT_209712 [Bimuria novae-zelandiae CBS 107.79]|uniref:Uncharacterized protein n=1 Tax=Bimuria novae-zelandiae CBS 107.79 TaxID=1447943 RepID=A0A6A5V3C6_9PLEO|nr:hypothetical protein BU23DRAFT_209712 [Bimuria novae-zelandiae CBS 107.79]
MYLLKASKLIDTASEATLTTRLQFRWDDPEFLSMKLANGDFEPSFSTAWLHKGVSLGEISVFSDKKSSEPYSDPYASGFDYSLPYISGFDNFGFHPNNYENATITDCVDSTYPSQPRHWTFVSQAEPFLVYNVATRRILTNFTGNLIAKTIDDSDSAWSPYSGALDFESMNQVSQSLSKTVACAMATQKMRKRHCKLARHEQIVRTHSKKHSSGR